MAGRSPNKAARHLAVPPTGSSVATWTPGSPQARWRRIRGLDVHLDERLRGTFAGDGVVARRVARWSTRTILTHWAAGSDLRAPAARERQARWLTGSCRDHRHWPGLTAEPGCSRRGSCRAAVALL